MNATAERWKVVPGYSGRYEASTDGRVRSISMGNGIILRQRMRAYRYPCVNLYGEDVSKTEYVHRVIAKTFIGEPPPGHQVNHKDGNKLNNRADNLEWVVPKKNMKHALDTGLFHKRRCMVTVLAMQMADALGSEHPLSKKLAKFVRSRRESIRATCERMKSKPEATNDPVP